MTLQGWMKIGKWATPFTTRAAPTPKTTPIKPPVTLIRMDSIRNCARMSMPFAPILMRRPISRVRSVTLTYMMFMIPMPPTSSEIPATAANSTVIISVVLVNIVLNSCWLRMVKSSSSLSFNLWLRRSISEISSMAWSVYSSLRAEQVMPCRWVMARTFF